MDRGFFGSKYFLAAAAVAALLLGGAASAYYFTDAGGGFTVFHHGCDPPTLGGAPVDAPEPTVNVENDGRRRIVSYAIDAAAFTGGALKACIDVGDIVVEPTPGTTLELVFEIAGRSSAAVSGTEVDAAFARKGSGLVIGAWEAQRGDTGRIFGNDGAGVLLTVRLPETGAYDLDVFADVGDVSVTDLLLGESDVRADVGNVALREVDLLGNVTLRADVGDTLLVARSVQSSRLELVADVGDATAELPNRPEIGYDATASTDVGEAFLDIGPTESNTEEDDSAGQSSTARSAGYAGKVTKVVVRAISDVGNVRITSN